MQGTPFPLAECIIFDRNCDDCGKKMHFQSHNEKWVCNEINCSNYDNAENADISKIFGDIIIQ